MGATMIYLLVLLIGFCAGHRAATALAAVSIGAWLGWIDLGGTWASFAGNLITVIILVILAIAEDWRDKLPSTGSRLEPASLISRAIAGGLAGIVLGLPSDNWIAGLVLGVIGSLAGAYEGFYIRREMTKVLGALPAALLEDVITAVIALIVVYFA